jgi:hypothetical protein
VRIGRFWSESPAVEIDAVEIAGKHEEAVVLGEAKWARRADGGRIVHDLERKATALPRIQPELRYVACAREHLTNMPSTAIALTAVDIFP